MFSESTGRRLQQDGQAFRSAQPFRFVVIDDFFQSAVAQGLLAEFPRFDPQFALNEMGEVGGKAVRTRVRELGAHYASLDDFIQSREFLDYVSQLTGIPGLLYDPDYEGGGTHENVQGQGLDQHIDFNYHPRTGWHRRLNLIVYLNPEWEVDWGGALQLYRDPWTDQAPTHEVLPLFNRCVVFETNEVSWHGFATVALPEEKQALSRRSFAIYLYTRERPAEETAPPHATVYVPSGMPADLQPGVTLDAERHLELRAGFARLRAQLRFLYERELEFTAQIERIKHALEDSRQVQRAPLQGYAIQKSVSGLWPDDWAGQRVRIAAELTRPARGVRIGLWAPAQLPKGQSVRIRCGDESREIHVAPGRVAESEVRLRLGAGALLSLEFDAEHCWIPSSEGASGDERPLAFRFAHLEIDHG
ncbi:2OG-Fe(II) oxygenase [Pseudomarimonas arenosa]|uniref:2OG-Fe(II) oxygenase n=1 Tax=Pseudomarimonas arenosa TaxID=2774145 RepID=A0AAW3ZSE1_9GAMM|nr:2OG-Fe(II) oxygenase [Pseudomarimonas arenosa]MBD8527136.1 2OG-Fe(II) oxygenase [Pseudomarimonas arenosa]